MSKRKADMEGIKVYENVCNIEPFRRVGKIEEYEVFIAGTA